MSKSSSSTYLMMDCPSSLEFWGVFPFPYLVIIYLLLKYLITLELSVRYFCKYRSVFDVTKGRSHYGPGGGYNHFAGRFVTFDTHFI